MIFNDNHDISVWLYLEFSKNLSYISVYQIYICCPLTGMGFAIPICNEKAGIGRIRETE